MNMLERLKFNYPILDRRFDFTSEELTQLELVGRVTETLNKVIDVINDWQGQLDKHELSDDISNKRKLSPTGNFTGNINGIPVLTVLTQMGNNTDKILYLVNQFADGQTGLVIDGGFFEASMIDKNYDGGRF